MNLELHPGRALVANPLTPDQISRLIDAVVSKIRAQEPLVREAEGEISVRIFRKGDGFDVKLTTTH
jgi:hypothetical protein